MTMRSQSPDVQILRTLLEDSAQFHSGQALAEQLGLSRVAVWKRLENLKKQGFTLEAIRNRGYRISGFPDHATEAGILSQLPQEAPLESLTLFEESKSTNSEVLRLLATEEEAPLACITRKQPGGRGRRGRAWSGDFDGNVYASVGFRPNISPRQLGLLTIWTGLRLCRRIHRETDLPVQLKWPNDLYLKGRKIAGILSESTFETERITSLVIGTGMNVNMRTEDIPEDLRSSATSLAAESGRLFHLDRMIAAVIEESTHAVNECILGIDEDRLADEWSTFACFLGQEVYVQNSDEDRQTGTMIGIDRSGALLLKDPNGAIRSYRAGDVSLRPL